LGIRKSFKKLNKVKFQGFLEGLFALFFTHLRKGRCEVEQAKKLVGFGRIWSDFLGTGRTRSLAARKKVLESEKVLGGRIERRAADL
jgi:hypothetical protein